MLKLQYFGHLMQTADSLEKTMRLGKIESSQVVLVVKNLPANAGDVRDQGSIPGLGRSPGEGNGNSLQYSCLEKPMERGAWWATIYRSQRVGHNWSDWEYDALGPDELGIGSLGGDGDAQILVRARMVHGVWSQFSLFLFLNLWSTFWLCDQLPTLPEPGPIIYKWG